MPPCCVLTATCLCNIYKGAAAVALLPITVYVLDAGENPLGAADPTSRAVRVSLVLGTASLQVRRKKNWENKCRLGYVLNSA